MTVVGDPFRSIFNRLLLQRRARDQSLTALQLRSSAHGAALKKTVEITGRGKILDSGMLEQAFAKAFVSKKDGSETISVIQSLKTGQ